MKSVGGSHRGQREINACSGTPRRFCKGEGGLGFPLAGRGLNDSQGEIRGKLSSQLLERVRRASGRKKFSDRHHCRCWRRLPLQSVKELPRAAPSLEKVICKRLFPGFPNSHSL